MSGKEIDEFTGPARVFDNEDAAYDAVMKVPWCGVLGPPPAGSYSLLLCRHVSGRVTSSPEMCL